VPRMPQLESLKAGSSSASSPLSQEFLDSPQNRTNGPWPASGLRTWTQSA
jgi:hypothetical protein